MTRKSRNQRPIIKLTRRALACAMVSAALIAAPSRDAAAQEASITLRTVTPYQAQMYLSRPLFIFHKMVEKRTNGRVKVRVLGGEEVVPALQQFDALRNGVVDVILGVTSYYSGAVPEALALLYAQKLPSELRKNGFHDLMRKIHQEKAGVVYLANAGGTPGSAFRLYLKKEVSKPDFRGLKIRVSPVYTALVSGLGGTPVSIPFADTYTALERGIVDGFGSTYAGIGDYALPEVAKVVVDHPFYSLNEAILLNSTVWNKIPADLRSQIEGMAADYEIAVEKYMEEYLKGEDEKLKAAGMRFIRFEPEDAKRYSALAYEAGWKAFLEKNPQNGSELKALAER